ncbi:hypothetical protein VUR80DRAFT_5203 [Thermomyces stellatus]
MNWNEPGADFEAGGFGTAREIPALNLRDDSLSFEVLGAAPYAMAMQIARLGNSQSPPHARTRVSPLRPDKQRRHSSRGKREPCRLQSNQPRPQPTTRVK